MVIHKVTMCIVSLESLALSALRLRDTYWQLYCADQNHYPNSCTKAPMRVSCSHVVRVMGLCSEEDWTCAGNASVCNTCLLWYWWWLSLDASTERRSWLGEQCIASSPGSRFCGLRYEPRTYVSKLSVDAQVCHAVRTKWKHFIN